MSVDALEEQLVKYLTDAHSIEVQALAQMRSAPNIAGTPELSAAFREHLAETEQHERLTRERLAAHGARRSPLKDTLMALGGKGFILFARSQPDTPGKLTAHAYSYEHLELASYDLLIRVAERANDPETVDAARRIREQERLMAERLEANFDNAAEASLGDDIGRQLVNYLADAHAIEAQAIQLLEKASAKAGDPLLQLIFKEHLEETRGHKRRVEERLRARNATPSVLKDAAMRIGGFNWGMFFQAQPDTPGKLAAFAFAFEHLEIAGYELLERVAARAGDAETVEMAESIVAEERAAAGRLRAAFDQAVDASLEALGVSG